MPIPMSTTTVSVLTPTTTELDGEAYSGDKPQGDVSGKYTVTARGVRSHIGAPSGSEIVKGGEQSDVQFSFYCDPVAINHNSWVKDEKTGSLYSVVWVKDRTGLGPSFVQGQIRRVEGLI